MDIQFCDGCDGSISKSEIDAGRVVTIAGRTYHAACAPRSSRGRAFLPWLLMAPILAAGLALGFVLRQVTLPDAAPPAAGVPDVVAARLDAMEGQLRGVSAQVELATAEARRRDRELGVAVTSRDDAVVALGEDLELVTATLEKLAKAIAASPPPVAETPRPPGEKDLATLLDEASAPLVGTRFSALHALARRPEAEALEAVRDGLSDPDRQIRLYALILLGERADDGATGQMVALLSDGDGSVREAAHRTLRLISGMDYPFDALAPVEERREQARSWESWWKDRESEGVFPPDDG